MALRDELESYNHDLIVGSGTDTVLIDGVQFQVEPWDRTTVADGRWLQQNAIGPLSARDIFLANTIDEVASAVNELSGKMGSNDGRAVNSVTDRFYSGGTNQTWPGPDSLIADGQNIDNNSMIYVPLEDGEAIVQMNTTNNTTHQVKIKANAIGYRKLDNSNSAKQAGNNGNEYYYDTQDVPFTPLIMKTDLPSGSEWHAIRNGDFEELNMPSADDVTIGINDDNQFYVKNFGEPKWIKTSNSGYIAGSAMSEDVESYLHGNNISTTSATYSTIIGAGSKLGRVEYSNIAVGGSTFDEKSLLQDVVGYFGGCTMGPSASLVQSLWLAGNGQISAGNNISNSLIIDTAYFKSEASAGGGSHQGIINLDGSNYYDMAEYVSVDSETLEPSVTRWSNQNVLAAAGGMYVSGTQNAVLLGGGSQYIHNTSVLIAGGGSTAEGVATAVMLGGGANVNDASYSFIAANGAHLNHITNSFVSNAGNAELNYVRFSVMVGEQNQCSADGIKYCYIAGSGNRVTQSAPMYSIFAGKAIECGSQSFALAMGEHIQTKGTYVATLGSNTSAYANRSFSFGDNNILAAKRAIGVLGNNNVMYIDESFVLGDYNLVYSSPNQMVIGDSNSAFTGSNSLTVGDSNENDGYNNGVFGNSNVIGGGGNQLVVGTENTATNSYVGMFGEHLRTSLDKQVQIGKFNVGYSDSMLEIGYGNDDERKTVFRVTTAGDVYIAGQVYSNQQSMTAHN